MLLKGLISSVNTINNTAEVILPEHNNALTGELPIYNRNAESMEIGDFVIVAVFDGDDICNGVIL